MLSSVLPELKRIRMRANCEQLGSDWKCVQRIGRVAFASSAGFDVFHTGAVYVLCVFLAFLGSGRSGEIASKSAAIAANLITTLKF